MLGFNEISYSFPLPKLDSDTLETWVQPATEVGLLGSVQLTYGAREFKTKSQSAVTADKEFLGVFFNLGADLSLAIPGLEMMNMKKNQFIVVYFPLGELQYSVEDGKYSTFSVSFNVEYLAMWQKDIQVLDGFLDQVKEKRPCCLTERPVNTSVESQNAIRHILYSQFNGATRNILFFSRVHDILNGCLRPVPSPIRIEKLERVKNYLRENNTQVSLTWLASYVSMDLRSLTRNFKNVYGQTIGEYHTGEKMNRALLLIKGTSMRLPEIATAVGYKSPSNFANAFKRQFGHSPIKAFKQLRKK